MRILLAAAVSFVAVQSIHGQCTPAVQKLINDKSFDAAKTEVQAELKKNDRDDAAMHCMGMILVNQDNSKDAVEWFEKAVRINDQSSLHHLWLANALGDGAQHASKIKLPFLARRIKSEFDRAAQLDPTSIDAKHGLIEYYSHAPGVMGGSMDKAKEQALEIEKLNAWRGHYEMAMLLERDKDVAGAEKEFIAATHAAPDTIATQLNLSAFYRRQKKFDQAIAILDEAIRKHPDLPNLHLTLAYALNQSGKDFDRAEKETRTWLASAPANAPKGNVSIAHFLLGQFAERQGKRDVAKAEYQQAVAINPTYAEAKKALDALK